MSPQAVGWERTLKGRLGARSVNLAATMDPQRFFPSQLIYLSRGGYTHNKQTEFSQDCCFDF